MAPARSTLAEDHISDYLDWDNTWRGRDHFGPAYIDLPVWVLNRLDKQAKELDLSRQELVRLWLEERLKGSSEEIRDVAE